jgi:hypothetical protein
MSHLIRHGNTYHFRYRFTPDLGSALGLTVFKMSLKTGSKREAMKRAKRITRVLQTLLDPDHPPVIDGNGLRQILARIESREANQLILF